MPDYYGPYISAEAVDALSKLPWETLDLLSSMLGRPTEGHIPWAIWRKSGIAPLTQTMLAMQRMGYIPFRGEPPLQLSGPRPPQLEVIHQALQAAYAEANDNAGPNPILLQAAEEEAKELKREPTA